ncbi:MAG: hypothetical protein HRT88_18340 [Lentisphaeraceae bacterium]|nr:hypothetical protein [Lentisphaeraceae bacterium]
MMKKVFLVIAVGMATSCLQLQVPVCSAVTNITVIKCQASKGAASMSGSKLDDIARGASQKAGDLTAKPK